MFRKATIIFLFFLFSISILLARKENGFARIDSLINAVSEKPFNGIVLISRSGEVVYQKKQGYSDLIKLIPLEENSRFVIGSISKQMTAAMVLQEYEKGKLQLHDPIKTYLPELSQEWADSVTIHDLLCHTHGIVGYNKPSLFPAGEKFAYSQIGYQILSEIVERLNNDNFNNLSLQFFRSLGMYQTSFPDTDSVYLVKGYYEEENGNIKEENNKTEYVPAGGFISTAGDLLIWNNNLYGGNILKEETLSRMFTKQPNAIRSHPIFGETDYGYGITVDTTDNIVQLGQTGYAPGFVSMDFYFPESRIGVIILENIAYDVDDIKKTFFYHTQILDILRKDLIMNK